MIFVGCDVLDQSAEAEMRPTEYSCIMYISFPSYKMVYFTLASHNFKKNDCESLKIFPNRQENRGTYAPRDTLDFTFDLMIAC